MRWLTGAVAALAAVTLLIARVDLDRWTNGAAPDVRRERTLEEEVREAHARLREAVYLDSLLPLLPAEPGVRVLLAPFVAPAAAAGIREATAHQLAGVTAVRARTGVFVVPVTLGMHPSLSDRVTPRYTYFAGTDELGAYCFVAAAAHAGADSTLERFSGLRGWRDGDAEPLGPCLYWARYGAPGPRVRAWLRASGYRFAERREAQSSARDARPVQRGLFGRREWSGRSLWAEACLAGDRQACTSAVTRRDEDVLYGQLPPDALPDYERLAYRSTVFGQAERALLAELERAFGDERFGAFWRSGEPVDAAFAAAFGLPLGEWVHRWALRHYPAAPPLHAAPDPGTVLLSILAIAGLWGAALVTARRRRIG